MENMLELDGQLSPADGEGVFSLVIMFVFTKRACVSDLEESLFEKVRENEPQA